MPHVSLGNPREPSDRCARRRETRVLFGKSSTEEMWVTEIDPEKRTVVKASSHGAGLHDGVHPGACR
ncbi:hypothetical protein [Rhodococcus opacus]|uniref:hypothetical protein n=1 Tax=Rhodococcus opacus TaxID=37919 RepID=UPI000B1B9279|nr:hypothetical protein [Rhodococcus opacus]